ncbi:MAG: ZIP family metal transporter [Candidatus Bathyarchaeota archaeon]|nr:MAG: ZIP family metal transporter [Candidatus Bathyarchaeota archaeon]
MFRVWAYSLLSIALVSILSIAGVFTLTLRKELQRDVLLYLVSFSVGGLLGGAFFHLLPDAVEAGGYTLRVSVYILFGVLGSFAVEKLLKWRHCHVPTTDEHPHSFAYMNLFGDAVHNFIDGLAIGASYIVSSPTGFATTLAVCLHELPQEIGDFGVLLYAGFDKQTAVLYNFATALTAFLGAALALILTASTAGMVSFFIPFSAGNFIYIASSDLIPELHSEERIGRTLIQFLLIVLGLAILYVI